MEQTRITESEDIQSLLREAASGDREAFKTIVFHYQQQVFLLAYSVLRNKEDAMDIVQETFMRLYQKLDAYEKEGNFRGWLLQIAKNLCIDYYRKHYARRRELESERPLDEIVLASSDSSANPTSSDLRRVISRGLEGLAERQRLVFVMKHYNGLDYREIAEILNIRLGTVKSLHFKAVRNLRRLLGPQLGMEI
jgi:RNA polymerase sigma-70 factor (ECF subfamily)